MAEVKNFNQKGIVTKVFEKKGTSDKGNWRMLSIGFSYTYKKKKTIIYAKTFGIKEGLPISEGDTLIIKGGILYNNSYQKDDVWINNFEVDANYAALINDTQHITLQLETDLPEEKPKASTSQGNDNSIPF